MICIPAGASVRNDLDRILHDLKRHRERLEKGIDERTRAHEEREELIRAVENLRSRIGSDKKPKD